MNGEWAVRGRRRTEENTLEAIARDNGQTWALEVGLGREAGEKTWDTFWRWNWSDLPLDWIYEVKEDKDSSDLGLSHWVIEGNVLMLWENWGKNRVRTHAEWKSRDVDWNPTCRPSSMCPRSWGQRLWPCGVSGRDDQYRSGWALLDIYLSLGKRIYFRMGSQK